MASRDVCKARDLGPAPAPACGAREERRDGGSLLVGSGGRLCPGPRPRPAHPCGSFPRRSAQEGLHGPPRWSAFAGTVEPDAPPRGSVRVRVLGPRGPFSPTRRGRLPPAPPPLVVFRPGSLLADARLRPGAPSPDRPRAAARRAAPLRPAPAAPLPPRGMGPCAPGAVAPGCGGDTTKQGIVKMGERARVKRQQQNSRETFVMDEIQLSHLKGPVLN
ncbi:basic proline-rich protein-like [Enhydra lutris kenyoni]|uniref:Basic proline-rich protein-like n=1 Tax=Enhydra lutris kenyoni TaxID=391180 RepID=A0A2Y9ID69_ENHLU|nr:basic proline-rich protein-like [Enhydra lutris kenyoni]